MSLEQLPFKLTYNPNGTPVDVSQYVASINSCKFQGSGKIRTASLMLIAKEGAFRTNTNGGDTPQVNQLDGFKITWEDNLGNTRSMSLEVDIELGQKTENSVLLPIELKGRERALQDIKFTAYYEFVTPFTAINLIIISYNNNKGTEQPEVTTAYPAQNAFLGVTNIYDFTTEMSYYDALMHILERLNQPTDAGGLGDFFSLTFEDNFADLIMQLKVQGSGGTEYVLASDTQVMHSLTERIDVQRGNQVFVRGQPNTGSVPNGFHDFSSFVEEINNYPAYNTIATYNAGQKVIENGIIFQANTIVPTGTPPPDTEWDAVTATDVIGNIVYSEWTNGKSLVTKNSCSNPENTFLAAGFDSPAFPDGNLVVRESFYNRDFVLLRAINDTALASDPVAKFYLRGQVQGGLYRGFRILVDTTLGNPGGSFGDGAGVIFSDRFGRSFKDAMVQWTGFEWIVFLTPSIPTIQDRAVSHCCVLSEGKVYEYNTDFDITGKQKLAIRKADVFRGGNPSGPFVWQDVCDSSGGNDPFHHPKLIANVDGLITDTLRSNQDISSFLPQSAIQINYEYDLGSVAEEFLVRAGGWFDTAADNLVKLFTDPIEDTISPTTPELDVIRQTDYYDFGWWYALPFPYPLSEFNLIPEKVGDIYGLGDDPNGINGAFFGSLDIQNTTFTSTGKFGFNNDEVSDLGSPYTALAWLFNFDMLVGGNRKPFEGDLPFTVSIYDDLSQVWRADYNYRHLGDTQDFIVPFSSFTVERPSRAPWSIDTIATNLTHTPELEIRSIFQERRVRLITWQLKTSYDDNERYLPFNLATFFSNLAFGALLNFETKGIIDGLRLVKQPFVSSGIQLARVLNSETYQANQTRNKRQLEGIAVAEQQRQSLQFESYNYETDIRCDLFTEQSVIVNDIDMIKSSDLEFADVNAWSAVINYIPGDAVATGTPVGVVYLCKKENLNEQPPNDAFWRTEDTPVSNSRRAVVMTEDFTYNAEGKKGGAILDLTLVRRLPVV